MTPSKSEQGSLTNWRVERESRREMGPERVHWKGTEQTVRIWNRIQVFGQ